MSTEIPQNAPITVLGAGFSRHLRPFSINQRQGLGHFLLRLQTEGTCQALVQGRMCPISPGDLLLYRPGDAYELRIDDQENGKINSADYFVFCQGSWMDAWWERKTFPGKVNVPLDEAVLTVWGQIIAEKRKLHSESPEIADYLLRVLLLSLERLVREGGAARSDAKAYAAYRIRAYVESHAAEPLTLEQVAGHVGLSVSRAVHLFKETFGRSIMDYAIDVRLAIARERILFSRVSLEQAAELAGFQSYSYFHRTFRARFGMSPKEYRNRALQ
jgi:AraC family transcriptional regulator of arabinose operon